MALLQALSLHSVSLPGCGGGLRWPRGCSVKPHGARAQGAGGSARAPQSPVANQRDPGAARARARARMRRLNGPAAWVGQLRGAASKTVER